MRSLNALLPDDVAVLDVRAAADGLRRAARRHLRAYCYRVLARPARSALERGRALHWPHPVDCRRAARRAPRALVGTHDFTAFTPTETDHVRFSRDVFAASGGGAPDGELLEFWIEADAFMRHMNRVLVGTMLEVAGGRRSLEDFGGCSRAAAVRGGPDGAAARAAWRASATGERVLDGLAPPASRSRSMATDRTDMALRSSSTAQRSARTAAGSPCPGQLVPARGTRLAGAP